MVNFTNLGAFGAGMGQGYQQGQLTQEQIVQQRMRSQMMQQQMQEAAIARQAQGAAGASFLGATGGAPGGGLPPMPYAQPMQPMPQQMAPGQPSVPMALPGAGGPAPGPMPMPGGVQMPPRPMPSPPQQPGMAPGGGPPPGPAPGPAAAAPGGMPGPQGPMGGQPHGFAMTTPEQVAQRIRSANPGIDNQTLFQAVVQAMPLYSASDKAQVAMAVQEMRIQGQFAKMQQQSDDLTRRLEASRDNTAARIEAMQGLGAMRDQFNQMRLQTQDDHFRQQLKSKEEQLDKLIDDRQQRARAHESGLMDRSRARTGQQGIKAQFGAYVGDIADVNRQITEITNIAKTDMRPLKPDETAKIAALQQQRTALRKQADDLVGKGKKEGVNLSFRDALAGAEEGQPEPAAPTVAPAGAPTATGPGGQKMYFDGKAWVPLGGEGGGGSQEAGGDEAGGGPAPQQLAARPAGRVTIRGKGAPSEVDDAARKSTPADSDLARLQRQKRGAGGLDAR